MNNKERQAICFLLAGYYFREARNADGVPVYKVFKGNAELVTYFPMDYLHSLPPLPELFDPPPRPVEQEPVSRFFKRDKKGRITLNLSLVRQEHGNTWIKKQYKKLKHEKNDHQSGASKTCTEETVTGSGFKACHPCHFESAMPGRR